MGIMPHLWSSNRLSCYLTPIFDGDGLRRVVARGGIDEAGAFLPPGAVELDMGGLTPILSPSVNPIEEWRDVTPIPWCVDRQLNGLKEDRLKTRMKESSK